MTPTAEAPAAAGPARGWSVHGALGTVAAGEAVGGLSGLAARRGVSEQRQPVEATGTGSTTGTPPR